MKIIIKLFEAIKIASQINLLKTIKIKTKVDFCLIISYTNSRAKKFAIRYFIKLLEQKLEEQLIECFKDYKMKY